MTELSLFHHRFSFTRLKIDLPWQYSPVSAIQRCVYFNNIKKDTVGVRAIAYIMDCINSTSVPAEAYTVQLRMSSKLLFLQRCLCVSFKLIVALVVWNYI